MMTLNNSHLVAVLLALTATGFSFGQTPGLRVRDVSEGTAPGSWATSLSTPSRVELRMVDAEEHEWVVLVPSLSIVPSSSGGATAGENAKFSGVLPWLEHQEYTRGDMASVLQPFMNPVSFQQMSALSNSGLGATDPAMFSVFCGLFATLGVSMPEDIGGAGCPVPAGATEFSWPARGYQGWMANGTVSPTGVFWDVGNSAAAPLLPEHHSVADLAKQVMLYQAATHLGPTITSQHVDMLFNSMTSSGILLQLDFVPMIITGNGGAGPIAPGNPNPRPLVGLPTGRPTIRLGDPVSITVLPGVPVGTMALTVIPMPPPLPSLWPYLVGESMQVDLGLSWSDTVTGMISANFWNPATSSMNAVPCVRWESGVVFILPPECLGGLIRFSDAAGRTYSPTYGAHLGGIFAFPVQLPPIEQ